MTPGRLLYTILLTLSLLSAGCGRIWGGVTWLGQNPTSVTAYSCAYQAFLIGSNSISNGPAVSAPGTTFSISPALPTGLSLDPNTGIISGSPTGVTASTPYTITAVGPAGTTNVTVNIRTDNGYVVNDLGDAGNVGPGCKTATNTCTLRAAIQEINAVPAPNVVVVGQTGQIAIASELHGTKPMDLYGYCGTNTTINGGGTTNIMHLTIAGTANVTNFTLYNGFTAGSGAGMFIDLAAASSTINVQSSSFINNISNGGVFYGSGIEVWLGATALTVALNVSNSTFTGNSATAARGGAIFTDVHTTLTVTNSTFSGNSASSSGGAISTDAASTISNSTFYGNSSTVNFGGALNNNGTLTMTLTNNTIYNNTAARGGGIYSSGGGTTNITSCTIANNFAANVSFGGGIYHAVGTPVNVANSIVAFNTDTGGPDNCTGVIQPTSLGYNISNTAVADCNFNQPGDQISTNPHIGVFQNNGGPTQTMALLAGSTAIGAVLNASCPATDQRGNTRPANGCDIGAYEYP